MDPDPDPTAHATPASEAWNEVVVEVFRLNGALLASGDAMVRDLGLTSARWQVLGAILLAPQALTVAGIAREMGLTRQGVQRTVNDLLAEGMLRLAENPQHRRARLVLATPSGRRAYAAAMDRQHRWMQRVAPGLDPARIRETRDALRRFRTRLEAAGDPAAALRSDILP